MASRSSSSTRPTRCSTWASPRTSRRSWPRPPTSARPRSSRRRSRRRSRASPSGTSHDPARIKVHAEKLAGDGTARVRQVAYVVRRNDKLAALCRILDVEDPTSTLVFARTRGEVDDLAEALSARGHDAGALHGGLTQEGRDRMMGRFRDGSLDVLVATDVAARGLDIEHVSHVVNYDVPSNPDAYVHRIGRTGRAGREGVAITLVEPREHRMLRNIEAATHAEARDRPPADGRRPARATHRDPARQPARGAPRRRVRPVPRRRRATDRRVRPGRHRARRGQPDRRRRDAGRRRGRAVLAAAQRRTAAARCEADAGPADASGWSGGPRPGPGGPSPRPGQGGPGGPPRGGDRPGSSGPWVRLFVGGGRRAGLRPGDLVGAITNEAHVPGGVVGAIQINEGFSLVDVQEGVADAVDRGPARGHDPRQATPGPPRRLADSDDGALPRTYCPRMTADPSSVTAACAPAASSTASSRAARSSCRSCRSATSRPGSSATGSSPTRTAPAPSSTPTTPRSASRRSPSTSSSRPG